MSTYLFAILGVLILYLIYRTFLSFFVEYLRAGYYLGFDKIAMIYRPLSSYSAIYKDAAKKYKHVFGMIYEKVKKNPEVRIVFVRMFGVTHLNIVDPEYIRKLSFDFVGNVHKRNFLVFSDEIKYGLIFSEG